MSQLFDGDGVITRWPSKRDERRTVLKYLASNFEPGRTYPEREVNAVLNRWHSFGDHALLRRELFEAGLLDRDPRSGTYWLAKTKEAID